MTRRLAYCSGAVSEMHVQATLAQRPTVKRAGVKGTTVCARCSRSSLPVRQTKAAQLVLIISI